MTVAWFSTSRKVWAPLAFILILAATIAKNASWIVPPTPYHLVREGCVFGYGDDVILIGEGGCGTYHGPDIPRVGPYSEYVSMLEIGCI